MRESGGSISLDGFYEVDVILEGFFDVVRSGAVEVYNEFSFQHELGIYLREKFSEKKVQFERNAKHFGINDPDLIKKEIDIAVFSCDKFELSCAFELKCPRNRQYPEQMYSFCKDIAFLEQLVSAGFKKAYFAVMVDDHLFYSGAKKDGIYSYFRSNNTIAGKIIKPTGNKLEAVCIQGSYIVEWNAIKEDLKYCIVEVSPSALERGRAR